MFTKKRIIGVSDRGSAARRVGQCTRPGNGLADHHGRHPQLRRRRSRNRGLLGRDPQRHPATHQLDGRAVHSRGRNGLRRRLERTAHGSGPRRRRRPHDPGVEHLDDCARGDRGRDGQHDRCGGVTPRPAGSTPERRSSPPSATNGEGTYLVAPRILKLTIPVTTHAGAYTERGDDPDGRRPVSRRQGLESRGSGPIEQARRGRSARSRDRADAS